jgi:hypothetical protein
MKTDALKKFEGKWVSLVVRGVPRNAGGLLSSVEDDYIVLNQVSSTIDTIIINAEDITSVLIRKQGENNGWNTNKR